MITKYFDKKFAKSLMEPKNILRKELKRHVTKKRISRRGNLFVYE